MFQWEEIQGHHLHVKVDRIEVPGVWHDYPASGRVYHSHINEWDLCPPIPPFSEVLTQEDLAKMQRYDDELDASDNAPSTLKAPSDKFATQHSGQMDELALLSATPGRYHTGSTALAPSSLPVSLQFDTIKHLKDRYGYDVHC